MGRRGHLKFRDGVLHHAERMDKAEPPWSEAALEGRFMHQKPYRIMRNHQGKEFLHYPKGFPTAQRPPDQPLMGVGFINDHLDGPSLVIGTHKVQCGRHGGVQQRRHHPVGLALPGQGGIGERRGDDPDHEMVPSLAPVRLAGVELS